MKSFIFNNFKERLLNGNIKGQDTWTFKFVNKQFVDDFQDSMMKSFSNIRMFKYGHMLPHQPLANNALLDKYWVNCRPVYYVYKKSVNTENAEKPTFVDNYNWDEFIELFPNNKKLKSLFLEEGGEFARKYDTGEVDENGNPILEFRGFYYVRTSEELRWCADKVNGNLDGISSDRIYNNEINIVLGDNIGTENASSLGNNKIINYCIGNSVKKPFNGIFFGNGFIIKNVRILCQNNNNGIVGVLGPTGIIANVRVEGNNILACKRPISITHLQNDATDVNAGILCGLNKGLITNSYIRGKVYLKGFVPSVYAVQNRTDSGDPFDLPESNRFYPSYLCINNIANIIPYCGYFAEGVFASVATSGTLPWTHYTEENGGKAYWKSNGVSCGAIGHYNGIDEASTYYPYDNSSCSEWAYPKINDDGTAGNITGHVLYYDINSMIWTQKEMGKEQSDWAEYLGLVCRRDKEYPNGNWGPYEYEIGASQIIDKPIKMHPFNRVAYCVGLFVGNNAGRIWNVRAEAKTIFGGTFVGFFGGLGGKWNARSHSWSQSAPEIWEVALNVSVKDDGTRSWFVYDTGDRFKTDPNTEGWSFYSLSFYDPSNNTYPTLANAVKLGTNINNVDSFRREVNINHYYQAPRPMGGGYGNPCRTNFANAVDYGENPVLRVDLGSLRWADLAQTAGSTDTENPDKAIYARSFSVNSSNKSDARNIGIYASYDTLKTYITGSETSDYAVSAVEISGSFYATGNKRPSTPYDVTDGLGLVYRDRKDKVTESFYHSRHIDNEVQVVHSNTFNVDTTTNNFVVKNIEFKIESLARVNTVGNVGGFADNMRLLPENDKFFSFPFGMINLHYKDQTTEQAGYVTNMIIGELEVTCVDPNYSIPKIEEDYNAFGKLFTYGIYSIVEARNVTFTVYVPNDTDTDTVLKFTVPVLNSSQFNANSKSRAPSVAYLVNTRYVDGCKNYHIKKRSIKNVGGLFGSVVLGASYSPCTLWNVSAYLNNEDYILFDKYANMQCNHFQAEVGTGWFQDPNGYSADNNFSAYSASNVYFKISGDGIGHPCLLKNTNNKCGAQADFDIYPDMEIASYQGQLMYRFEEHKMPHKDNDYFFANRYGGFAAICEINSSNISDNDFVDITTYEQRANKYINFVNTNLIYHEDYKGEEFKGGSFSTFGEGPMRMQYGHHTTCPFGVALPFIAEVKPTCQTIPTIIESPMSNLPSINDSSYINDESDTKYEWKYKRIGLFNNDINLANPASDPNFYSCNVTVDLPGIRNRISLNDMETGNVSSCTTWTVNYNSFTDALLDKLFIFSDLKLGINYMGSIGNDGSSTSKGFGWNQGVYASYPAAWAPSFGRTPSTPATDPDEVHYSDSKILNAREYFGSDLLLVQKPYSGHDVCSAYNIATLNHPTAIGEFYNNLDYMVSTQTFPLIDNKPFVIEKGLYDTVLQYKHYGLKGNIKQADRANSFSGTDIFKYNFIKRIGSESEIFNEITKTVALDEMNGQYGFYFKDYVTDIIYPDVPELSSYKYHTHETAGLDDFKYEYNTDGTLKYDEFGKPKKVGIDYDGRVFHIGMQVSERCIMDNLKASTSLVASGISADSDFEGMVVFDSEQRPVMYIDVGLGECDGSQSWIMPCSGIPGTSGLLLEIK